MKTHHLCMLKGKKNGSEVLTFTQRDKGDVVGENTLGNRWTGSDAGVVATIWRVHLGDIEVSCYLGDKAPFVQRDEGGEFVEDPAEWQLGCEWRKRETWQNANQASHTARGGGRDGVKMAHCIIWIHAGKNSQIFRHLLTFQMKTAFFQPKLLKLCRV